MSDKPVVTAEQVVAACRANRIGLTSGETIAMRQALEEFLANRAAQPALQAEPVKVQLLTVDDEHRVIEVGQKRLMVRQAQRALLEKITRDTGIKFLIVEGEAK